MRTLLLTVALLVPIFAQAETITGKIVGIADGDTVTLLDSSNTHYKIRLSGIDAPEKKQAYGNKSKEKLSDLVFGKTVDAECSKKDRYQRLICKIIIDGVDANLQQIKEGFAWWYKAYQKDQNSTDRQVYAEAEEAARSARKGLWSEANPIEPWEFRKMRK